MTELHDYHLLSICSFRVSYDSIMYHQFEFDRKAPRLLLEVLCAIHLISASLSFIHLKQVIRPVLERFIHQRSTGNWWLRIQTAFKNHHLASNARLRHIDINNLRVLLIYLYSLPQHFWTFHQTFPLSWWFQLPHQAHPTGPPTLEAAKASSICCSPAWHNGQLRVDLEGKEGITVTLLTAAKEGDIYNTLNALRHVFVFRKLYIYIYTYCVCVSLHIYLRMDDWKRFLGGCKCRNCRNIDGSLWQIPLTALDLHYPPLIQPFARSSALDPWKH